MASWQKILDRMRDNPRDNWKVKDIEKVCNGIGATLTAPTRGSHYKVSHPEVEEILTIPARDPIKQVYVKKFVDIIDGITGT
jgi:predicted RNA binding protein YcfA (HicA-like mRNA interferase family)